MANLLSTTLLILLFIFPGCAFKEIAHGTEITEEDVKKIKIGETTKQDIFITFGEPTKMASKESVFFFSWTRGSKAAILGIGSGSADTKSLVVIFDDNDIVKNYRITRGAPSESVQTD